MKGREIWEGGARKGSTGKNKKQEQAMVAQTSKSYIIKTKIDILTKSKEAKCRNENPREQWKFKSTSEVIAVEGT